MADRKRTQLKKGQKAANEQPTAPAQADQGIGRTRADYMRLRVDFAQWLMSPYRGTQKEWADQHRVEEATLSDWKRDPEFGKLTAKFRDSVQVAVPDILRAMVAKATRGDVNAARLVLEVVGANKPPVDGGSAGQAFLDLLTAIADQRRETGKEKK